MLTGPSSALSIDHYLIVECMGSFRRGQPDCGDIDILVTRSTDDGKDHSGLVQRLVETLYAQGIVSHTLSNPEDWKSLDAKWNGLLYGENSKMRRIDILGELLPRSPLHDAASS
jgi:DNA polymerase lambda